MGRRLADRRLPLPRRPCCWSGLSQLALVQFGLRVEQHLLPEGSLQSPSRRHIPKREKTVRPKRERERGGKTERQWGKERRRRGEIAATHSGSLMPPRHSPHPSMKQNPPVYPSLDFDLLFLGTNALDIKGKLTNRRYCKERESEAHFQT